ncbi:MAG: protein-tyrosine phosphatase family protein [Pararhodobacter sp.]
MSTPQSTSPSAEFAIASLPLGRGTLGICPLPGHIGTLANNLACIGLFAPGLVISLVQQAEMELLGAAELPQGLLRAAIPWAHFPIADFGIPEGIAAARWPDVARRAQAVLARGGKVLVHCRAGRGRSGMVALRLMVEIGENPTAALERLRRARPGAVETEAQHLWALAGLDRPRESGA